jgi:uncharacterized membrane protein YphA (DoxX/SURF4 family)
VEFLKNRWILALVSLGLGGAYMYASWHKISDPPDFAKIIYNYRIVPAAFVNLAAIYLPWFEILTGLAVVTGLGRRGGALGITFLALVFIAALSFNLYRGHPTICGCFDTHAQGVTMTVEEKFFKMKREIALDALFAVLGVWIFIASSRPRQAAAGLTLSAS